MKLIDDFLDRITMYRLLLYFLIGLIALATVFSAFKVINYDPIGIILSTLFLVFLSGFVNDVFSKVFNAPKNVESAYITALILALIINPAKSIHDFIFLAFAATLAMASKYILAVDKKHIFNPAAIAIVLTAYGFGGAASWWVGDLALMPVVFIGGYLIVRKIRREDLAFSFVLTTIFLSIFFTILAGGNVESILSQDLLHSSLWFFAFVMLTEPLTTPPTGDLRTLYGILVGALFTPEFHLGTIYFSPELALVVGNLFSYLISPKDKLLLYLKQKIKLSDDTYDFIFQLPKKITFLPGQYMEWTLEHAHPDSRGNRRYFTIASSPTEQNLRIGVKFYPQSSSYKKKLLELTDSDPIVATQTAGDFILKDNPQAKYVFIAGGIGVTPFRSILKYLIDRGQRKDIVVLFSNKKQSEIVYRDVFDDAYRQLGIRTIYTLTDTSSIPEDWDGRKGRIDGKLVMEEIPDFKERYFYLSGPHRMVTGFENSLKSIGIGEDKIVKDFFPGFV